MNTIAKIMLGLSLLLVGLELRAEGPFRLGVILGAPTGLSMKYELSPKNAIDLAAAFGGGSNFYLHSTWLIHKPAAFQLDGHPILWYYGVGGRLISHDHNHNHGMFNRHHHSHDDRDDLHVAARAPIGLRYKFRDPSIEVFGEIAAALDLVPRTDVDIGLGLGARYFF